MLLPVASYAFPIGECEHNSVVSHHWVEIDHRVIGQGVVSYEEVGGFCFDDGCVQNGKLVVSDCGSGTTVEVRAEWKKEGRSDSFDRSEEARSTLHAMLNSQERYSLEKVKQQFDARGFEVSLQKKTEENCACAAAFPKLRNGKKKFEGL
ncbi:hypothetical protein [Shimia sediminis]|uniref:hypothetical protein n=1 Tax=Shimia sediminis TaxID=2497945 RepID=UPI000F8F3511|nr:hypothetical protein [Shimia sediminis]